MDIALTIRVEIPGVLTAIHGAGVTSRASTSWYVWKTQWCVSFALISVVCCCKQKQKPSLKTWMGSCLKCQELWTKLPAFSSFCFSIFSAWAGLPRICDDSRRQGRNQQLQRLPALDEWYSRQKIVGLELSNPAWMKACRRWMHPSFCSEPADALNRMRIDKNLAN